MPAWSLLVCWSNTQTAWLPVRRGRPRPVSPCVRGGLPWPVKSLRSELWSFLSLTDNHTLLAGTSTAHQDQIRARPANHQLPVTKTTSPFSSHCLSPPYPKTSREGRVLDEFRNSPAPPISRPLGRILFCIWGGRKMRVNYSTCLDWTVLDLY